ASPPFPTLFPYTTLFRSRLHVMGEIYNRLTSDLLQNDITLPSSTGFGSMRFFNSGKMVNKGWELIFRGDLIRAKDFKLSANLNFSRNQNEILELPENLQFENYNFGNGNYASKVVEGKDRKSTRLNSSHVKISYAVFC